MALLQENLREQSQEKHVSDPIKLAQHTHLSGNLMMPMMPRHSGKVSVGQRDFRGEERADLVKLILFLQSLQRVIGRTEQSYWSWTNPQRLRDERPELSVSDGCLCFWIEKGYLYFERKGNQTSSPRPSFSTEVVLQVLGRHFSSPLSLQD